ncbi:MAG TPA: TadE family type IV pilus minor pilin [Acidimicrobiales bacterium]
MTERTRADRGQATVELALVLPLIVVLLMALVQAGLLVRDEILVTHAAREGARAAAVDENPEAAEQAARAAAALDPAALTVTVKGRDGPGSRVTVHVTYRRPARLPLLGRALGNVTLQASATMRVER